MPCVWVGGRCGYTKHSIRGVRVKLHVTTNQPTSHIQCIDVERCMSDHLCTHGGFLNPKCGVDVALVLTL